MRDGSHSVQLFILETRMNNVIRAVRRRNRHWPHIKVARVVEDHLVFEPLHSELGIRLHVPPQYTVGVSVGDS